MANRNEPQDSEGLDIEEIESSPAPGRLRSRPRELIQIDHEEVEDNPPPTPRPMRTTSSGDREARDDKKLRLVVLGILGVLLLSNLIVIYQINSFNTKIDKMSLDISQFVNKNSTITKDLEENLNDSKVPISSGTSNLSQNAKPVSIKNDSGANAAVFTPQRNVPDE